MNIKDKIDRYLVEGEKRYHVQYGVGKTKYLVSYHDGKKKHPDGSDFYDVKILKNKRDLWEFFAKLKKDGYVFKNV